MTENETEFFPLYVRPALSPVVIIGWLCALAAAITAYTWLVVQCNDSHYEGVTNSRCHIIYERVNELNGQGQASGFTYDKEISRHLEILTDEQGNVQNWRQVEADCQE
jgi:hypothetical protein